jgi:adenylate cyclase
VADVAGRSRLVEVDKEGMLSPLKALRAEAIDPKIAEHHGRISKPLATVCCATTPAPST